MKKLTPFYGLATRFARLSALLVVCCSIWPAASSAQLTQQDMTDAIIEALYSFGNENGYFYTLPLDNDDNVNYLSSLLEARLNVNDPSSGIPPIAGMYSVAQLEAVSAARLHSLYYWLRRQLLPVFTNSTESVSAILDYLVDNDLGGWLQEIEEHTSYNEEHTSDIVDLLERQHFNGNDLQVYDDRLLAVLQSMASDLSELGSDLADRNAVWEGYLEEKVSSVDSNLEDIGSVLSSLYSFATDAQISYSNYWSREPPSSYPEIDTEISEEDNDAEVYFENIDLPTAGGEANPQPSGQLLDESWLELGHVDVDEDHNALIRLVDAPSRSSTGPIPTIEVDLGRDSALDLGMRNFASWVQWLTRALFGLLLSVKGLGMWRVVRTASVAAQAGTDPFIHLAWNPF